MNKLFKMSTITACVATMLGLVGCGDGESAQVGATPGTSVKLTGLTPTARRRNLEKLQHLVPES